jgi:glycosyltransferase involved in cell wall biosynthesis
VHDCINAEYSYASDWRLPVLRLATLRLLRNAARVVAISNATKSAILRNYDIDASRITVIPSACRLPGFEDAAPKNVADIAISDNFVLLVTNALPHKNAEFALKVLSSCRLIREQAVKLRIIGEVSRVALEAYRSAGLEVEVRTRISDEELHRCYREARFLMSPSLAEGHNLPIAEAICCGGNVVCSDIDVHREFYSGCAIFFDPWDVDSAVAAVDDALSRTVPWSSPAALSSRSFADVAQDYRAVFESVGGHS